MTKCPETAKMYMADYQGKSSFDYIGLTPMAVLLL